MRNRGGGGGLRPLHCISSRVIFLHNLPGLAHNFAQTKHMSFSTALHMPYGTAVQLYTCPAVQQVELQIAKKTQFFCTT